MLSMDLLCSTAQQWALACVRRLRRVESTPLKNGFFTHVFSSCGCATSELVNTQATLAKLFVRGASRAVASRAEGWSVKILSCKCLLLRRTNPWRGLRTFWGAPRVSGLPVHARSRCRSFAHVPAVAIEAIRTVRRRARSGPRPTRSARRGSNRSWSAPCTRTRARDCPRRNPSTLATARTRALLPSLNHNYVNKHYRSEAMGPRGSAPPAPVIGAGRASWCGVRGAAEQA